MSAPVLVTGATGFLGGRLAAALLRRGERVRLLHRSGRRDALSTLLADSSGGGVAEPVEGDLTDVASLSRAAAGCGRVVHAAAHVSRSGRRETFHAVNVEGLRLVVEAAVGAGVDRIVYTSSFVALGPSDLGPGRRGAEAGVGEADLASSAPFLDHYQASKHEAALLARRLQREGVPLVVLYPGVIVGPGPLQEANLITTMVRDHLHGRLVPLPEGGRPRWSFVHVDDVVAGHLAALDSAPAGTSWALGGENAGLRELFVVVGELTGHRPPWLSTPHPLPWLAGLAEEALEVLTGRAPTQLTRGVARIVRREWALDSSAARRELGFEPRSLEATLRDTIGWLEREGHVPAGTLRRADGQQAAEDAMP